MKYTKKGKEVEIFFLDDNDIHGAEYREFLKSKEFRKFKHAESNEDLFDDVIERTRENSYFGEYKVLVAKVDGKIVGQSCAFKVYAIAKGRREELWWSIDAFLMASCRGIGIGGKLQQTLHDELPNFSSAWYTPVNGIIKQKCGAHGLFDIWFNYYPVSSAITVFGDLCFRKLFKHPIPLRIRMPYLYSTINSLFIDPKLEDYEIAEITYSELGEEVSSFMEEVLSAKDFHIERSEKFLKWKYKKLRAGYHMLRIGKNGRTEAIIAFSNVYDSGFDEAPIKGVTIYDIVISSNSKLTEKKILLFIARWYKRREEVFDGFQMLSRVDYLGRMCYPFHSCPVLSTLGGEFPNSYLTFADHDMDQI